MAVTVHLDLYEGSNLVTLKNGGTRDVRVAFVDGLTVNDPGTFRHMAVTAPGIPRKDDPHPSAGGLSVVGFDVRPVGPTQAFVYIFYESKPTGGAVVERLAVRDTGTLGQESIQRHPDGTVLKVYPGNDTTVTPKIVTLPSTIPLRNRVLYGLFNSPRPESWKACLRKVNGSTFEGFGRAYWLCSYYDEQWSDADRKFRVTIGFTTKQVEDWRSYKFMQAPDGQYTVVTQADLDAVAARPYVYGVINETNGVHCSGLFDTENFDGLFSSIITRIPAA